MIDLDPKLLRAFVTVVEVGTINGAARSLNRTQAAVSMQIQRLEELLDIKLFERSARGLKMTAAGMVLLSQAQEILRINDDVLGRLSSLSGSGRVRLGVLEDFASSGLIEILKKFRDQYKDVQIDIVVENNRTLGARFEEKNIDLAICDVSVLDRKPVIEWTEQLYWTVRDDICIAPDGTLPIIMFDELCPWRERAVDALNTINWTMVCEAGALAAVSTAIRVGVGVGLMTYHTIPPDCRVLRQLSQLAPSFPVTLGLFSQSDPQRPVRTITQMIAEHINSSATKTLI
ncbi:MAG: LysR family transcriptional regulator [Brucellaceae bacterium]|jgi:DNA-binding transcriptional LysR family regulator|nr:LysR family transcriptional regulator [Brucellaceae bacterium]